MYANERPREHKIAASAGLLSDRIRCVEAMRRVVESWPVSTSQNLSNTGCNRRAWLGQACCCLECGSTDIETCLAWRSLSSIQQDAANALAELVIAEWEDMNTHAQTLFG